jgi:murein DD-endopeptidase MepM/ murein hydrolase activator NlpD
LQRAGARDRRHPAGGRARLIAAFAAFAALLLPLVLGGSASGRLPDEDVVTSVREAHIAADRLASLSDAADDVIASVASVQADVDAIADRLVRARRQSLGERRSLDLRVDASREAAAEAARSVIPQTTDPDELSRPFEAVTAAIHASDGLAIQALDAQAEVARFARDVAALAVTLRRTRFGLATTTREVDTTTNDLTGYLRAAIDGRARAMVADVRRTPERAAPVLGNLHAADLTLRTAESRLAGLSAAVDDWRTGARRAISSSRRTLSELYGDMLLVQSVVASVVPSFSSIFEGVTAPPVEADGPGPLYVCPVDPPRSYSDDWGAPRFAGGFHLHEGNDIFAVEGTPIRAPFDGTAIETSNTLGGIAVGVYGADGYAYNAHLLRLGELGEVTAGTVVGYVGNTGDADATPPHDHFEWHPGNGAAVDPYLYLDAVC